MCLFFSLKERIFPAFAQVNRINPVVTLEVTSDKSPVFSLEYNMQRYSLALFCFFPQLKGRPMHMLNDWPFSNQRA